MSYGRWGWILVSVGLTAMGCAKDPSEGVGKARVENVPPAPDRSTKASPATPGLEVALAVQPVVPIQLSGDITFTGSKVTGAHSCKLTSSEGSLGMLGNDLTKASFQFNASTKEMHCDPDSRNDWTPKLEEHLRGEDFFWAEKYPTASFQSTAIEHSKATGKNVYDVTGQMTLRGVTKQIQFSAVITAAKGAVSGSAKFSINRKDFGIEYPGKVDDLIRDNVVLEVALKGTR